MRREVGGALAKVLVALLIVAVLAAGGLFALIRASHAIRIGTYTVGGNETVGEGTGDPPVFRLGRGGEIYVATTLVNDGRFSIRIDGLGDPGDVGQEPYLPGAIRLGDGATPSIDGTSLFSPVHLKPGSGVGVVIAFVVNPDLVCKLFPDQPADTLFTYADVPIRYSTLAIGTTDVVHVGDMFAVEQPTRTECESAIGTSS